MSENAAFGSDDGWRGQLQSILVTARWYWRALVTQFLEHDCPTRAGALTYTTLFAVVPLMTVAYTTFSILPAYEGLEERIEAFIFNNFVPDSSALVKEKLVEFSDRARGLTAVGFVFLFLTSFLLLVTIEQTFNAIWKVPEPRRGFQRILLYWAVLSLGPPMVVCGILISAYFASLPLVSDLELFGSGSLVLSYLPLLLTWIGFTVLYYAMPNCRVRLRHAFFGGFLAMLSFEFAKYVFNFGVSRTSIASIYGTFAVVPFFLFWMYLVWVLVLCGAIAVRTMSLKPEQAVSNEPALVKSARVLEQLHGAHLRGLGLTDSELREQVELNASEHDRIFTALRDLRAVTQDDEDRWLLSRSLKTLTLWDLYQCLPEGLDAQSLEAVDGMEHVVEPLRALLTFGSNQMAVSLETVFGGST